MEGDNYLPIDKCCYWRNTHEEREEELFPLNQVREALGGLFDEILSAKEEKPDHPLQLDTFKMQKFLALVSASKFNGGGLGST